MGIHGFRGVLMVDHPHCKKKNIFCLCLCRTRIPALRVPGGPPAGTPVRPGPAPCSQHQLPGTAVGLSVNDTAWPSAGEAEARLLAGI